MNTLELEHQELQSARTGEKFSLSAIMSSFFDFKDLFVHHEIIPPGRRSSSPHFHSHREEMIYVIEGRPTAHIGSNRHDLSPGDFLGFKPGEESPHVIENRTENEVKLLVISSNPPNDTVHHR